MNPIRRGWIYWIPDSAVELPPTTRPKRTMHPRRPFLVTSSDVTNADDSWLVVLGYPLSTAGEFRSEYDVDLAVGDGNVPEACQVQIALLQPIAKTKLRDALGQLSANTMELVDTRHLQYIGVL